MKQQNAYSKEIGEKNGSYEGFLVDYSLHIRNLFPQVKFSALNQQI